MINITLKNEDIGLQNVDFTEKCHTRYSSRGIVIDPNTNKIAIIAKTKINEYKLPGGGREGEETEEETFCREVLEETGCKVRIIDKLGTVYEERSNIDLKQFSTLFIAELIEDTGKLHPTQKEKDEGLTIKWMDLDNAINTIRDSYNKVLGDKYEDNYVAHFVIKRDLEILEEYKSSETKQ